jgi:hypothetical protein
LHYRPSLRCKHLRDALLLSYSRMVGAGGCDSPTSGFPRRSALSYVPVYSTQQRQRAQVAPQFSFPAWGDPQGHQGAVVRLVGLENGRKCHTRAPQVIGELRQISLRLDRQRHREGPWRDTARTRFTGRMHDLCCLYAPREVLAYANVVRQRIRVPSCPDRGVLRRGVVASTCDESTSGYPDRQGTKRRRRPRLPEVASPPGRRSSRGSTVTSIRGVRPILPASASSSSRARSSR